MCRTMPGGQVPEDRCTWGDDQFGPPWGWRAHQMDVGMADAGQGLWWAHAQRREERPHQDVLTETMAYGDQPLTVGRWPSGSGRHQDRMDDFQGVWQHVRLDWHVWQVVGALGGATSCSADGYWALKGPTSPFRGLTPCIFCSFWHLACKKWQII